MKLHGLRRRGAGRADRDERTAAACDPRCRALARRERDLTSALLRGGVRL